MSRVYAGQSALLIPVQPFGDWVGVSSAVIKYRKPGGVCGEFSAGVGDEAKGVIFHECIEEEIDMAGWWVVWAFITFAVGRTAAGEAEKVYIWHEGRG
jgi:hypothetical protein